MKEMVLIYDEDLNYSKKFCNQANKILGKKYNFLSFSNVTHMKKYMKENEVSGLIVPDTLTDVSEDLKAKMYFLLNEKDRRTKKEGRRVYIYKLQNIKNILDVIDGELNVKGEKDRINSYENCKLVLYYSPIYIKNKLEIVKKISKAISKNRKVLIVDLDEFDNYKGNVGLSNIIYSYKENILETQELIKEIVTEKDQDIIKSVTYPEDFNVITNIDLANIVNTITKLNYDYIFVNADSSYVKCQYILNDAESVIIFRDKELAKNDKFKAYMKNESQIDVKKLTVFDIEKFDKTYLSAFCKQNFSEK